MIALLGLLVAAIGALATAALLAEQVGRPARLRRALGFAVQSMEMADSAEERRLLRRFQRRVTAELLALDRLPISAQAGYYVMALATLFFSFNGGMATYESSWHRNPVVSGLVLAIGLAIFSTLGSIALLAAQQLSERRRSIVSDFLNDELRSSPSGPWEIHEMPGRKVLPTALGVYGLLLACLGAGTFVAPPVILGDRGMYLSTSWADPIS